MKLRLVLNEVVGHADPLQADSLERPILDKVVAGRRRSVKAPDDVERDLDWYCRPGHQGLDQLATVRGALLLDNER